MRRIVWLLFLLLTSLAAFAQAKPEAAPKDSGKEPAAIALKPVQLQRLQAAQEQREKAQLKLQAAQAEMARVEAEFKALLAETALESQVNPETHETQLSRISDKDIGFAAKPKKEPLAKSAKQEPEKKE